MLKPEQVARYTPEQRQVFEAIMRRLHDAPLPYMELVNDVRVEIGLDINTAITTMLFFLQAQSIVTRTDDGHVTLTPLGYPLAQDVIAKEAER